MKLTQKILHSSNQVITPQPGGGPTLWKPQTCDIFEGTMMYFISCHMQA